MHTLYDYKVISYRIIDIDSIELVLDLGFNLTTTLVCRLFGLDGPERKNKYITTKLNKWAQEKLSEGLKNDELWARSIAKDKFSGRFVGEIFIGETNLNKLILEFGYGKPYYGGSKAGLWTEEDLKKLKEKLNE